MTILKSATDVTETLIALFEKHTGKVPESITPLAASGSDRKYYRMVEGKTSVIGTYNENVNENNTYFYFTDLLTKHEINVPEIFIKSKDKRYYLQQDLGDTSLFSQLIKEGHTDEVKNNFRAALHQLIQFQWVAGAHANFDQCFATKKFDEQAIMADLMYFKYYFADLQKIHYDKRAVLIEMEEWSRELGRIQPQVLMFRDFQSRNIMVHEGKTYFIDYQGAMQGPPHYDIASLLWQAKAQLPQQWKEDLLRDYIEKSTEYPAARVEELYFRKGYQHFVLLRLLQVLGAYGYRGLLEKRPHFISSIAPALKSLEQFLENNPQLPNYPQLRNLLEAICSPQLQVKYASAIPEKDTKLKVQINSFSYKNGLPEDKSEHGGGFIFDCRGILNPGRYEEYKYFTGKEETVQGFLKTKTKMPEFLEHVYALVSINVDDYIQRGFEHLSISFGCTGGQHRSVYAAEQVAAFLEEKYSLKPTVKHLNKKKWLLEKVSK